MMILKHHSMFQSIKCFLCLACVFVLLQSMVVTGLVSAVVTTLERQFKFTSSRSGLMLATYDIAVCIFVVPVSYYGGRGHIPRVLGTGLCLLGIGALIFSSSNWLADGAFRYDALPSSALRNTCGEAHGPACDGGASTSAFALLLLAQVLLGIGACPLYPLSVKFLDRNTPPAQLPVYLGTFYAMGALGPAIGYMVAGISLSKFVDGEAKRPEQLSDSSSNWVGAWWEPFLGAGLAAVLFSVTFARVPKSLRSPHTEADQDDEGSAVGPVENVAPLEKPVTTPAHTRPKVVPAPADDDIDQAQMGTGGFKARQIDVDRSSPSLRGMAASMADLLRCKPVVFNMLGQAAEGFVVSSMSNFLPLFIESEFSLTPGTASFLTGAIVVPGFAGGIYLGGYLVQRWRLSIAGTALFCWRVAAFNTLFVFIFLISCGKAGVIGVDRHAVDASFACDPDGTGQGCLNTSCNLGCGCQAREYEPVCGVDGSTFFSACVAGCNTTENIGTTDKLRYAHCPCIGGENKTAVPGFCSGFSTCDAEIAYFSVLLLFGMFFTALNNIPATLSLIKTVPGTYRADLEGLVNVVYRIFGSIPGPIVFGGMIDQACSLFKQTCGDQGNCLIFQSFDLRMQFITLFVVGKLCAFSFFFLAWYCREDRQSAVGSNSARVHSRAVAVAVVQEQDATDDA